MITVDKRVGENANPELQEQKQLVTRGVGGVTVSYNIHRP
jgi:hypothetical protein